MTDRDYTCSCSVCREQRRREAQRDELVALRAEVEAHKRSRQIDANEARSREMELRQEIERLRTDGIHSCHDECPRIACVQRREIERLAREVSDYRDYFDASEPDTRRWASGNARTETLRQARAAIMSRRIDRDRDADPTGESL